MDPAAAYRVTRAVAVRLTACASAGDRPDAISRSVSASLPMLQLTCRQISCGRDAPPISIIALRRSSKIQSRAMRPGAATAAAGTGVCSSLGATIRPRIFGHWVMRKLAPLSAPDLSRSAMRFCKRTTGRSSDPAQKNGSSSGRQMAEPAAPACDSAIAEAKLEERRTLTGHSTGDKTSGFVRKG
jgi:hypothetical protein